MLRLWGEKVRLRARLSLIKDGPRLALYDEKGKVIWEAP